MLFPLCRQVLEAENEEEYSENEENEGKAAREDFNLNESQIEESIDPDARAREPPSEQHPAEQATEQATNEHATKEHSTKQPSH